MQQLRARSGLLLGLHVEVDGTRQVTDRTSLRGLRRDVHCGEARRRPWRIALAMSYSDPSLTISPVGGAACLVLQLGLILGSGFGDGLQVALDEHRSSGTGAFARPSRGMCLTLEVGRDVAREQVVATELGCRLRPVVGELEIRTEAAV